MSIVKISRPDRVTRRLERKGVVKLFRNLLNEMLWGPQVLLHRHLNSKNVGKKIADSTPVNRCALLAPWSDKSHVNLHPKIWSRMCFGSSLFDHSAFGFSYRSFCPGLRGGSLRGVLSVLSVSALRCDIGFNGGKCRVLVVMASQCQERTSMQFHSYITKSHHSKFSDILM